MRMSVSLVLVTLAFAGSSVLTADASPAQSGQQPEAERFTLKTPEVIEEVPCAAGYMWRCVDGRLRRCTLERDAVVRGAALPKGSTVAFNPDGSHHFVFLPRTTTIEGFECRGHGHDFMTTFHPDGRLKLCWMPEDREIQGIPCARFSIWADVFGNSSGVYLHADGALAECRVSRDTTVGGTLFNRGSRIYLDPSGRPTANPHEKTGKN